MHMQFPEAFVWGAATAAAQIEGAVDVDGRGESIWDCFARQPGAILDGSTPSRACDSYHRTLRDIDAIRQLGLSAYRFSIAWPRVVPEGAGPINERGLDHYERFVDDLLCAGVEPYITLFHWDLPQSLEDKGGWLSRQTAEAFADYAAAVGKRLAGKVRHFMTFNEIPTFVGKGYRDGTFAPGKRCSPDELRTIYHHVLLAHGLGVQALRSTAPDACVGLAHDPTSRLPMIEDDAHIAAAAAEFDAVNGYLLGALFKGSYPDGTPAFPANKPGDLQTIAQPLDFLGLNIYSGQYVAPTGVLTMPAGYPTAEGLSWLAWCPTALYWTPRFVHERYFSGPLMITENGYASSDRRSREDLINDVDRIAYLRQTLAQVARAIADGIPIGGYFVWSLMDNFEWAEGYSQRFGVFYTDYERQTLTPKASAAFYAAVVRHSRVM